MRDGIEQNVGCICIILYLWRLLLKAALEFYGGVIPYQAQIGKGTRFAYQGLGVVIHKKAIIGSNCFIRQNVTIGGGGGPDGLPTIGDNVDIGAGAVLIGGIHIGNNVKIGANAVVNKDLPDDCTAVGVPVRIIKHN